VLFLCGGKSRKFTALKVPKQSPLVLLIRLSRLEKGGHKTWGSEVSAAEESR